MINVIGKILEISEHSVMAGTGGTENVHEGRREGEKKTEFQCKLFFLRFGLMRKKGLMNQRFKRRRDNVTHKKNERKNKGGESVRKKKLITFS